MAGNALHPPHCGPSPKWQHVLPHPSHVVFSPSLPPPTTTTAASHPTSLPCHSTFLPPFPSPQWQHVFPPVQFHIPSHILSPSLLTTTTACPPNSSVPHPFTHPHSPQRQRIPLTAVSHPFPHPCALQTSSGGCHKHPSRVGSHHWSRCTLFGSPTTSFQIMRCVHLEVKTEEKTILWMKIPPISL